MPDPGEGRLTIELAFATPSEQHLVTVELEAGAVVEDAVAEAARFREFAAAKDLAVGVWGKCVDGQTPLRDGDRVEFYRPLRMDPREARRRYAALGQTMVAPRD